MAAPESQQCTVCLEECERGGDSPDGRLLQGGCACRGAAGLAHVQCRVKVAEHADEGDNAAYNAAWAVCGVCNQGYTGETMLQLARALMARWEHADADDEQRLCAENYLSIALGELGQCTQCTLLRRVWPAFAFAPNEMHGTNLPLSGQRHPRGWQ